jgi:thiol:disulfide interchange protein DsbD|tara:strand:+ start:42692 stop:44833 length:2142 start_codon:yes stop_codon:yes gene_type:complete
MRLSYFTSFCLFITLSLQSLNAAPVRDIHVEAELIAQNLSIQPGETFTVGLRLDHDEHWHTYWKSSATGYATSVEWDLPEGFTASDIQWPTPKPYALGDFVDFVFEGEIILEFELTAPETIAAGDQITLNASAEWLMCKDTCILGSAELSLSLPVSDDASAPDAQWAALFAKNASKMPLAETPYSATAWTEGNKVYLAVSGDEAVPSDLYFFDDQIFLKPVVTQPSPTLSDGTVVIELEIDPDGSGEADSLTGVLSTSGSWIAGAQQAGWALDVAWGEPVKAAVTNESGSADEEPTSLLGIIAFAFIGGLILNLMPCVFPVIGIKIMGFVNQAGEDKKKIVLHGLTFTAGVLISFWLLAGLLLILRSGGNQVGWGFQLQNPAFVFLLTAFLFAFGLNMSGLFEIGTSAIGVGSGLTAKSGLSGSFFSGVLATVVATPCAAPFLAPALGVALTIPPLPSLVLFTAIGLGLSTPYLLLSAFPSLINKLPRPGPWMETFKQGMAFLLYATAGYLLWVLVGQMVEEQGYAVDALLWSFFALVLLAVALWVYGRWCAPHMPKKTRRIGLAVAILVGLGGLALGYPKQAYNPAALAATDAPPVQWEKWAPGKAEALAADGKVVYVDFTARWCTTCQVNKKAVFSSAEVRRFFAENDVVALKADWTSKDATIAQAIESYGRAAVPLNLIFSPSLEEEIQLPELLTPGVVLNALERAKSQP